MGAYSLTAKDSIVSNIVRKTASGALSITESKREDYSVPPEGEYEWEITGFAEPFEMAKSAEFGGGMQTKTRLEFTILSGKGQGRKFNQMFTWSVGSKATLGQLIAKVRGQGVGLGETFELTDLIGMKAKSYVNHSVDLGGHIKTGPDGKPLYAEVAIKTIRPLTASGAPAAAEDNDSDWT
jgi:hypothetical protein